MERKAFFTNEGAFYVDDKVKQNSRNLVTSGAVFEAIKGSVIPANVDVIKWSDVQAVTGGDYSEFTARIAADIVAGIAPVVLDDTNGKVATLQSSGEIYAFAAIDSVSAGTASVYVISDSSVNVLRQRLIPRLPTGTVSYDSQEHLVYVNNDRSADYTYTGTNILDFVVEPQSGNVANFAVKITSTSESDGTVTVCKLANGIYIPLMPSVAGGDTVEAGKTYQLTCVGDCWTLSEFEEPSTGLKTKIGDKFYNVVKIGSLYWMAENLAYNATAETGALDSASVWYGNDSSTYGDYGKLYTLTDEARAEILAAAPGWRFPTEAEVVAMLTGKTYADIKSATGWTTAGTDSMGFNAKPSGQYDSGDFSGWGTKFMMWCLNNGAPSALEVVDDDLTYNQPVQPGSFYYAVRLVKDVT